MSTVTILYLRCIALILGVICIGLGSHAYFESEVNDINKSNSGHEVCKAEASKLNETCPSIGYEIYFLIVIYATFFLSLASIIFSRISNFPTHNLDSYFHVIAGVMLLIGGIMMIISAEQLRRFLRAVDDHHERNGFQLYDEKIAAGSICLFNGVVYMIMGPLLLKNHVKPGNYQANANNGQSSPSPNYEQKIEGISNPSSQNTEVQSSDHDPPPAYYANEKN